MTFVDFSNHPVNNALNAWYEEQIKASTLFRNIYDLPFPLAHASADVLEVDDLAKHYVDKIISLDPDCAMYRGEFILSYKVIAC